MTFLQQLFGQTSSLSPDEERFWSQSYAVQTNSGTAVTAESALKISAAWACSRLIAESVAMLPRIVYRNLGNGGKERATSHPLYDLLHDQPNRRQTSFEFIDMLQMHALLRGSGYAKIIPGVRGAVDRLIPVHPDRVTVEEVDEDTLRYRIKEKDGGEKIYLDDEIFHLRGLTLDGVNTVSVITYARESFGLTLAAERYGAKLFANYSQPGGVLKHPGELSTDAQDRLRGQFEQRASGENLHRMMVLEEGMEWQQMAFTPEDSQMLETRVFQAEDVCRWYRVPPHMIGLTSKATSWGSGIEELSRGFVTYVLMPWLIRWQQAFGRDLIVASEKYYVEFLTDALLRGDVQKRYSAYAIGRNGGWLATNEVRQKENMNPIEGGDDDYLRPLNMEKANAEADMPTEPLPPVAPTNDSGDGADSHYQRVLRESAARVVRKEIAAIGKAEARADGDAAAFKAAVFEFFAEHADFVSQTMQIPAEIAERYCVFQTTNILRKGAVTFKNNEIESVAILMGYAEVKK